MCVQQLVARILIHWLKKRQEKETQMKGWRRLEGYNNENKNYFILKDSTIAKNVM